MHARPPRPCAGAPPRRPAALRRRPHLRAAHRQELRRVGGSAHRLRAATAAPTASMSSSSPTRIAPSMLFRRRSRPPWRPRKRRARPRSAAASSRRSARLASPGGVTFTRSMSSSSFSISAVSASSASSPVLANASRSVIPRVTTPAASREALASASRCGCRTRETRREINKKRHEWTAESVPLQSRSTRKGSRKSAGRRGSHSPARAD